jgi:cytochrome c
MRRSLIMALWAGILILTLATFAQLGAKAQEEVAAGHKLAEKYCARCHAIGETGLSPHAAAPLFRAIAAKGHVDDLQEALAEGIMAGHQDMPEFEFQPQEIVDFLAYLKGLAPRNN